MPMNTTQSRRQFLQTTATAAATSLLTANLHAGGGDTLKIGLIGCGGRGTGAASQALLADPNVKLWAVGDAFRDRAKTALTMLRQNPEVAAKVDVPGERQFVGFDAYRQVIGSGVD